MCDAEILGLQYINDQYFPGHFGQCSALHYSTNALKQLLPFFQVL
uniref:Uncharacterized protein n=1 Tax=Anguilla anguilla TaxID=7936 RepID=A0A0E9Q6Z6_ANGAN